MHRASFRYCLSFLLFALLVSAGTAHARIDILPRRIIIDNQNRSGEITILNLSEETSLYRIAILSFRQNEDGLYENMDGPLNPAFDPEQIVRFSPRQFTLPPGARQKIRISLRKPENLPPGEYRFHVQAMQATMDNNIDNGSQKNLRVNVKTNVGVSIPVIVRHGDLTYGAKLSNPVLVSGDRSESGKPEMHVRIDRSGNSSTIGRLEVIWQPQGAESRVIGYISNMNIFAEVAGRNAKVPLNDLPAGAGTLAIRYSDEYKKGQILDEIVIQK